MKPRIYADTSVIGGYLDREFRDASAALIQLFKSGQAILVLSNLTLLELDMAPKTVRGVLDLVPDEFREYIELTEEASRLARQYLKEGVLGESKRVDAQHIAMATIARVDVVVSWNFKHIVNLERIRGYNSVNLRTGYSVLEIRTPREVTKYGK